MKLDLRKNSELGSDFDFVCTATNSLRKFAIVWITLAGATLISACSSSSDSGGTAQGGSSGNSSAPDGGLICGGFTITSNGKMTDCQACTRAHCCDELTACAHDFATCAAPFACALANAEVYDAGLSDTLTSRCGVSADGSAEGSGAVLALVACASSYCEAECPNMQFLK
ncbi:MAG: hypothetical protein WDO74_16875 [Pseudomonadota bacterium]